ncbi:McrC family protein [Tranquillimonas alkanivorans]|uniref:5-methylcytosine-specific restriction enzyme subunit McrC n=1 Tax=Tranquillimonas alkanivorans TaxID=441119 RepID=A0A1I5WA79_9RHOB|nr:hypothetical protein [Tranquillimonas alkanivorans]SFQ16643.1 5-methylcytosine-specific restriction enzyme subunit McrC [Tranquillimonas alkanivorans]
MFTEKRIIEVEERGRQYFRRRELVDHLGHSLILPETRELKAIEFKDVADGFNLVTLGVIGYLPLTRSITLNIVPKFPIDNLWTMLNVGGETYSRILPTIRRYQKTEKTAPIYLLARSFCHYLRGALSAGFARSYYPRTTAGYYQPRVEFGRTISQYLSRGNPVETVSTVYEFGLDSSINQIVKAGCLHFSKIIPATKEWEDERRLLQTAIETLRRVTAREPNEEEFYLHETVSLRLQRNYEGLLHVYQLLLTGGGIAFSFESSGSELPSFLFNLEDIFERFVRQTFVDALRKEKISVLDGNKRQGKLFEDSKTYPIKPDIVFRRGKNDVIGLGEVKYKPKVKEADRYQIISHVTAARAPVGILISPTNNGESQRLDRLGRIATGAQFYHYRIDLGGDIRAAQDKMVKDIQSLFPAPAEAAEFSS